MNQCVPLCAPERSHPALCDLQPRVPHQKQTVWPPEEQRPRLRPLPRRPQLHKQKQKGQEEEQIVLFFFSSDTETQELDWTERSAAQCSAAQCSAPSRRTLARGNHFYKVDFNGLEVFNYTNKWWFTQKRSFWFLFLLIGLKRFCIFFLLTYKYGLWPHWAGWFLCFPSLGISLLLSWCQYY